jgi:hypothetical protein
MMAQVTNTSITYKQYNEQYRLPEQEQAEQLLMKHKHFILGWEPGKSKSYPVIHCILEVQKLKQRPIKVLVMSDATCIKEMWKAEIMPQNILPRETYFVTDRTAIGAVKPALVSTDWDVIVIDECQSLRSGVTRAKSKYSKLVHALTKRTEYVWGMTGTLSGNNNIEPWCVLHNLNVAGMGNINVHAFKKNCCDLELQYGPFGNFLKPVRLNSRGEEILDKAYKEGVMFWGYDEDDNMPPMDIRVETFKVKPTPEYKNALEGILKLGEHESTTLKAIALQKAQQALNGFLYYDDEGVRHVYQVADYVNPKIKYVVEACRTEKTIVGYRFQEDGKSIEYALDQAKISWTNDIKEFKLGQYQVLVLQCSRGKSANLQMCQNIIYYTADFSFINYKQFIHRTWRRGQTKPCKVTFLVNDPGDNHKVEFKIWGSLRAKQSIHDMLMNIKQDNVLVNLAVSDALKIFERR